MSEWKHWLKMERCHVFFLLLVNLWTEYGVLAFQEKQFEEFLQCFLTDNPHFSVSSYLLLFVPLCGSGPDIIFMHSLSIFMFVHHASLFLMRKICTIICNRYFIMLSGSLFKVVLGFVLRDPCLIRSIYHLSHSSSPVISIMFRFYLSHFSVSICIWYPWLYTLCVSHNTSFRKNYECSGFIVFCSLKLLQLLNEMCWRVHLSHKWKCTMEWNLSLYLVWFCKHLQLSKVDDRFEIHQAIWEFHGSLD
jgi:hypothetical protein